MAQSDARFGYKASLGRTDHNLSQPFGFSCCPGMLLPIWYDFATPGDSYYMSHDMPLLRSIQLLAPSMVDVKVHYETFFVPIQMIYQYFENSNFSLTNAQSSFYGNALGLNTALPVLDYDAYVRLYVQQYSGSVYKDGQSQDAFRLADLFGLHPTNWTANLNSGGQFTGSYLEPYTPSFFPYQILTYNTIYQYYYRLDDKSQFSNANCNWDRFYNQSSVQLSNVDFMQIYQRPWDFDYYTSIYRSPIVSDANLKSVLSSFSPVLMSNGLVGSLADMSGNYSIDRSTSVNRDISSYGPLKSPGENIGLLYGGVIQQNINTSTIRQMFANEKLAMITGRTKKNYDSQVLAHYGIDVPHDVKHDLTMIHHDEFELNVQEVTNLASSSTSPLGELAGKSYSAGGGKQFKFTAPCHGVIMTIFSVEPKKRYVNSGFDRINAVTNVFDLPTPEFDRLGNMPMYRYEVGQRDTNNMQPSDIIGWKERYYYNKRKAAKVTFGYWTANGVNNYGSYFINSMPFGQSVIGKDSQPITDTANPRPDLAGRFYIERGCLDNQVYQPYYDGWKQDNSGENWDLTPWLLYARDPFIVNSHIKCKKVSWMSKDGEPVYNF